MQQQLKTGKNNECTSVKLQMLKLPALLSLCLGQWRLLILLVYTNLNMEILSMNFFLATKRSNLGTDQHVCNGNRQIRMKFSGENAIHAERFAVASVI